jgi:hypothetical protein
LKSAVIGIDNQLNDRTNYWRSRHVSVKIKIGDPRSVFLKKLDVAIALYFVTNYVVNDKTFYWQCTLSIGFVLRCLGGDFFLSSDGKLSTI